MPRWVRQRAGCCNSKLVKTLQRCQIEAKFLSSCPIGWHASPKKANQLVNGVALKSNWIDLSAEEQVIASGRASADDYLQR